VAGARGLLAGGVVGVPAAAAVALLAAGSPAGAITPGPTRPPGPDPARIARVPDLVGMPVGRARAVVSHSRLRFAVSRRPGHPFGRVVAMRPQGGSLVAPGAVVVVRLAP
jgi:PASTA domain